ncbi:hemocyte protein-glutamine gamma-glutamyltransferase-like [Anneissia japonica]|uniref:hemocyte protein-glutamine gamma-glutamyltransferase-like n=1 Tax=Anneissia japonica TaxID=1529436 RepID=UPI0014256FA7|nr:hemocyte protein-glutamine gamma-glutamyltransferase-like [Anneissia japonica]
MVNLVFGRAFDATKDKISAELRWGPLPKVSDGTRVVLPTLTEVPAPDFDDWGVHVTSATGDQVSLAIYIRSDSLIGNFELVLFSELVKDGTRKAKHVSDGIYILFNPWSEHDDVYMHSEEERQEYVLNDQGMYFYGSMKSVGSSRWYFGQFEDFVLECVFELLSQSRLKNRSFSDPVFVARMLSSLMNSLDNDGVLVGNWSGDYEGGTEPTAWTSSSAIIEEFYKTKLPVMFGQCWVFAALLTTVYRAIGIPARNVCNTGSAHDTDFNCLVDKHYDSNGQPMPELDEDSIWNFHCWVDAWMARPDLPSGYGGWQALDATPQETSFGIYQMGPAPLIAIRKGHVQLSYDTKFVFAEVNATTVKWKFDKDLSKPPTPFDIDEAVVGYMVVTKAVGKFEKFEITDQYKPEEGSVSEYFTLRNVNKYVSDVKKLFRDIKKDVQVELVTPEDVMIGQDVELVVLLHSESDEKRSAGVSVTADSVYYTGVRAKEVKRDLELIKLASHGDGEYRLKITAQEYLHNLVDHAGIRFSISVLMLETEQLYTKGIDYKLKKPTITVTAPATVSKGAKFVAKATFTNPLNIKLQSCYFNFDGSAIVGYKKQPFRNVNPGETVSYETEVTAKQKLGVKDVIVTFTSADLIGVGGDVDITIVN